jgi:protein-S-isoprenylcysteine O-methyltransferase Ste14
MPDLLDKLIFILWFASEVILTRAMHSGTRDTPHDRSSLRILWAAIILSIAGGVWCAFRRFASFGDASNTVATAGMILIVCGIVLRWTAILTLRRQFTVDVALREGHRVITTGLYRIIRHPAYAGSLLSFLGLGLSFASPVSLVVVIVPITAAFLYRIRIEEGMLRNAFGEEYLRYCAGTKRLIPGIY